MGNNHMDSFPGLLRDSLPLVIFKWKIQSKSNTSQGNPHRETSAFETIWIYLTTIRQLLPINSRAHQLLICAWKHHVCCSHLFSSHPCESSLQFSTSHSLTLRIKSLIQYQPLRKWCGRNSNIPGLDGKESKRIYVLDAALIGSRTSRNGRGLL